MYYKSDLIDKIRGGEHKKCYMDLDRAVDIMAKSNDPDLSIKEIADQIAEVTGVRRSAVLKSLSRAVEDIWNHGDLETLKGLYEFNLKEKPTPKELVSRLAAYQKCAVEYQISMDVNDNYCLVAWNPVTKRVSRLIPLGDTKLEMEKLLYFMNRIQAPIDAVEDLFRGSDKSK